MNIFIIEVYLFIEHFSGFWEETRITVPAAAHRRYRSWFEIFGVVADVSDRGIFHERRQLFDWSCRSLREDKKGAIPEELSVIQHCLPLDSHHWCYITRNFQHSLFPENNPSDTYYYFQREKIIPPQPVLE